MLLFGGAFGLLFFAVWIFCVIDVITTPENRVRNLPKLAWIFIVILLIDVGAIAWLLAGRPWQPNAGVGASRARSRPSNPDDDEEFLASLQARADEQRRRAAREAEGEDDPPKA